MSTRTARRRRRDGTAHAFCQSLALDLRLEGIAPVDLVRELGIGEAHAVAVLDGHPTAVRTDHLHALCDLAGVDLLTVLRAVEGQTGGDA